MYRPRKILARASAVTILFTQMKDFNLVEKDLNVNTLLNLWKTIQNKN